MRGFILAVVLLGAAYPSIGGCLCVSGPPGACAPNKILTPNSAFFIGTVVNIETAGSASDLYRFSVEEVVVGSGLNDSEIEVEAPNGECGVTFVLGARYLVHASGGNGNRLH